MSEDLLSTYVHDHLAGASGALDLLKDMRDDHEGEPMGRFAAELLEQIQADRETLAELGDRLGEGYSKSKEAVAWIGAKLSRVKLGRSLSGDFGVFQALETLGLGIQGKLALWRALAAIAESDIRLRGMDFDRLSTRAIAQHTLVEEERIALARSIFEPANDPA